METAVNDDTLARHLSAIRKKHELSLEMLAQRSGVSKATLSRIESGATSPTASVLNNICAVYGITLSQLLYEAESGAVTIIRNHSAQQWQDPDSGYIRTSISPPTVGLGVELLKIEIPAGGTVNYDKPPIAGLEHHIYLLDGELTLNAEGQQYQLAKGDCIRFKAYGPSAYHNPSEQPVHYIVALGR